MTTHQHAPPKQLLWTLAFALGLLAAEPSAGQPTRPALDARSAALDRVLTLSSDEGGARDLPADGGATGLWQRLQKLGTTASVLHVVAHPDDEHGGVLAYLSRGQGARVALLSLNRGEGGANALGPELFDALGLVRTEELLLAGAYYGLDDLYFTALVDYGFSKTLGEAFRNWGREEVLREVVRVIRINRPLVVLSRFHGSERDGHGHHQAAGVIAQEAFDAAGDPSRFPEQIQDEGLRPWQPLKLYRGGVREGEPWHPASPQSGVGQAVEIDAGTYSPWLGQSYRNYAARGLSLQRSQMSGRYRDVVGPDVRRYERLGADVPVREADVRPKEASLFDGLDTSLPGLFDLLDAPTSPEALAVLEEAQTSVEAALAAFSLENPSATVPALARGLEATRHALSLVEDQPDVRFHLQIKEQQFMDAINAALGVRLTAVGVPAGTSASASPWAPLPTMGLAVPGQPFRVEATLLNPSPQPVRLQAMQLTAAPTWEGGVARTAAERLTVEDKPVGDTLAGNAFADVAFEVTVPDAAEPSRRYFYRESIQESRYAIRDSAYRHLPHRAPPLAVVAAYDVEGVPVQIEATVQTREANFPYGYDLRTLKVAPALAVNARPERRVVPEGDSAAFPVEVELAYNGEGALSGALRLDLPEGWTATPERQPFAFAAPGERQRYTMAVTSPRLEAGRTYTIEAVAEVGGEAYRLGYEAIKHRDLDVPYLYRPATTDVRAIDVEIAPDLQVGYVMGVGDEVPAAIEQLGADVQLLAADALAADLARYDAIVIGTRAYAVRPDLRTYNGRLLDYARAGGHLIVLYQTPEFDPSTMAPYPAELPPGSEEVSEEDASVRVLAPEHPLLNRPNAITEADFEGWVEQRGSKFFSTWDAAYTPLIASHDAGQAPQEGGWLTAPYGDGHYTYFAYAVHRQLPYGVPGAFRLFANVLSLGQ